MACRAHFRQAGRVLADTWGMALRAGDRVVAVRNFGGVFRQAVPAGAAGVVVDAPLLGRPRVEFRWHDFWHGDRVVTEEVEPGEIAVHW
jgi:hypothetical protein